MADTNSAAKPVVANNPAGSPPPSQGASAPVAGEGEGWGGVAAHDVTANTL